MLELLTNRARRAVKFAHEEANRSGGDHVGTDHLLLGLAREEIDSGSAGILARLEICLGDVRREVESMCGSKPDTDAELDLSPYARAAFEHAAGEASLLGHERIGPEHLLLGLLDGGTASIVLVSLGINLANARSEVMVSLGFEPEVDDALMREIIKPEELGGVIPEGTRGWARRISNAARTFIGHEENSVGVVLPGVIDETIWPEVRRIFKSVGWGSIEIEVKGDPPQSWFVLRK